MRKKILITGGAGFLGINLVNKLITENDIYVVDNLSSGNINNISIFNDHPNFKFINNDISKDFNFNYQIDEIYNLACPASPPFYQMDPIQTMKTSVLGSFNVLDLALRNDAKILQTSTSEIYGDPLEHPQKESYKGNVNPIGIRSCYDEGKRAAESIFFDYNRIHNTKIKVVRIFNTYGPYMNIDDGRVVSNFICQALLNRDITVYGNGNQTRSFCFVDDMIDGLVKMMNTKNSVLGPINLGNPYELTMLSLAQEVIKLTKSKSKIIFQDLPSDDPVKRKPDISAAKEILKWSPKVKFTDGLISSIDYFKNKLKV
jgi:UDP-glucuronate decarboxylase